MKLVQLSVAAVLALACAPLATACSAEASAAPAASGLRSRFNEACDTLARKAAARQATREDYDNAVEAMRALANQYLADSERVPTMREKVVARINQLEILARSAAVKLEEADVLKDMAIDLELIACLNRMKARVLEGKATRLEWAMAYETLTFRAEYAKDFDPEIDAIAGRLRDEIKRLEQRVNDAQRVPAPDVAFIDAGLGGILMHTSAARLGRRTLTPGVKPVASDYSDVMDMVIWAGESEASEFARKVQARLDEIKAAVQGGRITRAEYDALRDLIRQRARQALSGS